MIDPKTQSYEAAILGRTINPEAGDWSPTVAQGLLSIALSPTDRQRMDELAAKAQEGTLSPEEELEIESYRQVCRMLDLMKIKARITMKRAAQSAA